MAKLNMQDLAAVLVEKSGLEPREALRFVVAMFETIRQGISNEKQVKVKGLGTFKVIGVEARESVNVNTGERVMIDSHAKITFTPDATMKELVNKPFSGFETVVLNEGVSFDDMPIAEPVSAVEEPVEETVEDAAEEFAEEELVEKTVEERTVEEELVENAVEEAVENVPDEVETAVSTGIDAEVEDEEPVVAEEEMVEEPASEEEPALEEEIILEDDPVSEEDTEEDEELTSNENNTTMETEKRKSYGWVIWLLLCAACVGAGYYLGQGSATQEPRIAEVIQGVELDSDTTGNNNQQEVTDSGQVKTDSVPATPAPAENKPATAEDKPAESKPATAENKPATAASPKEQTADYLKYEDMDSRVRTGAYYIMGTAEEVTAKEGETLERISRRILGDGMVCYVEVYNGMKANEQLKEGQKVKIPKLELKKRVKSRNATRQ